MPKSEDISYQIYDENGEEVYAERIEVYGTEDGILLEITASEIDDILREAINKKLDL